jgi:hexosaminidase
MGFLQDAGSWIMMPKRISVEVSDDGRTYRAIGTATHDVSDREMATVTRDFVVATSPTRARFVRVTVERYGLLPDWHPGKGHEAWFFADEISID